MCICVQDTVSIASSTDTVTSLADEQRRRRELHSGTFERRTRSKLDIALAQRPFPHAAILPWLPKVRPDEVRAFLVSRRLSFMNAQSILCAGSRPCQIPGHGSGASRLDDGHRSAPADHIECAHTPITHLHVHCRQAGVSSMHMGIYRICEHRWNVRSWSPCTHSHNMSTLRPRPLNVCTSACYHT